MFFQDARAHAVDGGNPCCIHLESLFDQAFLPQRRPYARLDLARCLFGERDSEHLVNVVDERPAFTCRTRRERPGNPAREREGFAGTSAGRYEQRGRRRARCSPSVQGCIPSCRPFVANGHRTMRARIRRRGLCRDISRCHARKRSGNLRFYVIEQVAERVEAGFRQAATASGSTLHARAGQGRRYGRPPRPLPFPCCSSHRARPRHPARAHGAPPGAYMSACTFPGSTNPACSSAFLGTSTYGEFCPYPIPPL